MRYLDIKTKIQNNYEDLPKNQRKVADFFIENFDKIPFLSVQNVSLETDASVASVVRFAQRVGFSGFSEMRVKIADELQNHLEGKSIFPLLENLDDDTLTSVANTDIKNINDTLALIDRANFHKAIDLINRANRVYTAGLGISFLLSQILAYQLNQVGINAFAFRKGSSLFLEQALFLENDDIVITFSFPPYSAETIDVAKYAKEENIPLIAITNREASPITFYSTVNLVVKSENMLYTNSFAAISVLINAISTESALRERPRAEAMLKNLNRLTEKYYSNNS